MGEGVEQMGGSSRTTYIQIHIQMYIRICTCIHSGRIFLKLPTLSPIGKTI